MTTVELLKLDRIDSKRIIQMREDTSRQTIQEYADIYRSKPKGALPPIVVFRTVTDSFDSSGDKRNLDYVADGVHRVAGARLAGLKSIEAEIIPGGHRDALLYACGCNAKHGLRRTPADKRRAVQMLLGDSEWGGKSDRWIAEKCGVSHPFVAGMRKELETLPVDEDRVGRDGKKRRRRREVAKPKWCVACGVVSVAQDQNRCQDCAAQQTVAPVDTAAPTAPTVDAELVVEVPKPHVANNSGCVEWYTPDLYLDAVRSVLGTIELDPASCEVAQQRVQAERFYTADDDGLSQSWSGKVFLNPPYANGTVGKFTDKLVGHVQSGAVSEAILLVNNATDTAWFQAASASASAICFPSGRIRFLSPEGEQNSPLQGQAILYFGRNPRAFREAFSQFGIVFANPPQTAINSVTQVLDSIRKDMGEKFTNPKTDREHLLRMLDRHVRRILAA